MLGLFEGKITILLDKYTFKPGEIINVKTQLDLNSELTSRSLNCVFYGTTNKHRRSYFNKRAYTSREAFIEVRKELELKTANSGTFNFEIKIPADLALRDPLQIFRRAYKSKVPDSISNLLDGVLSIFGIKPKYFIKVYLDLPNKFDIISQKEIFIDFSQEPYNLTKPNKITLKINEPIKPDDVL